LIEKPVEAV